MMQTEKLSTALTLKEQGNVLVKERRYKEALQKYEEAIQFDPLLAAAWLNKGMMHAKLQEYSKAVSAFEQALKIDPNCTKAKSKHKAIQCYLEEEYTEAIEADPNFAPAWLAKVTTNSMISIKRYFFCSFYTGICKFFKMIKKIIIHCYLQIYLEVSRS